VQRGGLGDLLAAGDGDAPGFGTRGSLKHPLGPVDDFAFGVRAGVVRKLLVADQAVEPVVRDPDLQGDRYLGGSI
jgi:hypothetical protein